ncbi:MAG: putative Ig domain-containing protein, partial [Pseudomonadota bacterium]
PPTIFGGALPDVVAQEDAPIEIELPFIDNDAPFGNLEFSMTGLPAFLSEEDGLLTGTAGNDDVGTYDITVTATDPNGGSVTGTFELEVENVNDAPEVTGNLPDVGAITGLEFDLALPDGVFTDVDAGDSLTYRAEGLPPGLEIDPATGRITGTPTTSEDYFVTVFAEDQSGEEVSTEFNLFVSDTAARESVTIEAEDFVDLDNFYASFASAASGNEVVRVNFGQSGTMSTDLTAAGVIPGLYEVTIQYFDESDGESEVQVFLEVGGVRTPIGDFAMDATSAELPGQGNATQAANRTTVTLPGAEIPAGARLVITGQADGGEYIRIDKVTLDPVVNLRPVITSGDEVTMEENGTAVLQVQASDPEGEALTYTITGGADAALFEIDDTGALSFVTAPDFEAPADAGGNNLYEVRVTVSDGVTERSQEIEVTVTDGDEPPVITSAATADAAENQTDVATVTAVDVDSAGTVTFGLSGAGADDSLFDIDPDTGVLTFKAAPDFEAPSDAGGDGVYDVKVTATAGGATATQDLAITVTDANDAPEAVAPAPDQSATITASTTIAAAALFTDQDGDGLTLTSVTDGPAGLSIVDGALTGTPTETGTFTVTVEASDGTETASTTFTLTVTEEVGPFGAVAPNQDLDGDGTSNATDNDVDGDGTVNTDDDFAYDAANGVLLADGEAIDLTFDQDGTPYQNGFTGLFQAATGAGNTLKAFDEETGAASVAGGLLSVETTTGDTGGQNTPEDDYQVGIKNADFTVEGRVLNPFVDTAPVSFDQLGLHVGVDSTDFVKFVFGNNIEFSSRIDDVEAKATGGNQPLPAGLAPDGFSAVDIRLVVNSIDGGSASVTAFATFLDGTGNAIPGATDANFGTLSITGAMAAALADDGVAVGTGFTHVHAGNSSSFTAQLDSFKVTPTEGGPVAEPGNALDAFASQGDLDTSQSYGANAVGSAVLEIMTGNNNIESSNFSNNSFQVTNTGDKKISAIFIDATTALYPDSVFDPDGLGGDSAAKPWAVNNGGNTGGFIGGGVGGYFLPGPDPIPNSGGSGGPSNGGYKGAMVKFNPGNSGGFQNGETVGFSGDMDPNSIAGMTKASVDGTAIDSWDVGGISGHELIGSVFTVLFDDGTTASGQLASDGSASGSQALATQDDAVPTDAPGLLVNGVAA